MEIKNRPRRTAQIWMGIALLGVIIIFIPGIIGMDGFDGGYALSVGGGFVFMMGIIAAVIYFKLAKSADTIIRNENVLARWTYSPEQWRQYTEEEHKEDAAAKWGLFVLIAVISVVVGIIMAIMIGEDFLIIALIILGIIAVAGLAALFSTIGSYLYNKKYHGEAYLTADGVYFNNQMHVWKGMGNRLESISVDKEDGELPRLTIVYSTLAAYKRNSYTVRIPVPPGQEENAQKIVSKIEKTHLQTEGDNI